MKIVFAFFLLLTISCVNDSTDVPARSSFSDIDYLETKIQDQMDREDILEQELESARMYI